MKRPFIYTLIIIIGCVLAAVLYLEATDNADELYDDLHDRIEYSFITDHKMLYGIYKKITESENEN